MIELNDAQKQAVEHKDGPMLVIAGAGTGKTRVITERIAHLIEQKSCSPNAILALTFTEKAAGEMEARLDERMPIGYESIQVSTFHSFCEKILRQYGIDIGLSPGFKLLEGVNQWKFLKEHLFDFELSYYLPSGNPTKFIESLVKFFGRIKDEVITVEDFRHFASEKALKAQNDEEKLDARKMLELAGAYEKHQSLMAKNDFLDFADLQFKVIELLNGRPNILKYLRQKYLYILVDEYQDTNIAQNHIVDLIAGKHRNLMVVGDDDQSIYKFRGAAISNILQFEEKYPDLKKVVITRNYRSNQKILDLAYASIQNNNPDRLEVKSKINKQLKAQSEGKDDSVKLVHCTTVDQEVAYVLEEIKLATCPLSQIAILVRANAYSKPFVDALKKENIPYQFLSERGLYGKDEVKELISLLRVVANPTDDISFFRVLRMDYWKLHMQSIVNLIDQSKKKFQSLWSLVKNSSETKHLAKILSELIEYSKEHTAGEVLFKFTQDCGLYETLLSKNTIEAEEKITNIASFFGRIHQFERESEDATVVSFVEYLNLAEEAGENPAARFDIGGIDGVQISTVHGAKGLEFHTVFLPSLAARRFPSDNRGDTIEVPPELISEILTERDFHLEEERRLFYVAVTRAKENLHLLYSDFYSSSNSQNPRPKKPSVFVQEIADRIPVKIEKTAEGVQRFLKPESVDLPLSAQLEHREPLTRFSYSALSSFEDCPRKFEYNYLLKIPQPPNGATSFGSSLHNTLNEFYTLVTQSKQASLFEAYEEDLTLYKLLKIFDEKWIPAGYESKAHMETLKKRGKEILTKFHEHFKNEVSRIEFLEKGFKLKMGDYTITGRIDRADRLPDGTLEVIDYKSGKSKSQKDVDKDQQLMIYALAARDCFGLPASKLTLYFLDDDLKVSTEPDSEKLDKMKGDIIETADQINKSDFAPTPSKFVCGFCPYNKICDRAEV
ncbi:ATP-dependent helicase [Patescibacteria group bacterium]|nr:ATP-dependent helicase [Patescibacteria group bacterium]MBU1016339.1 ATP-dependent helicase [Patescibacteria group bacterium]MBU1685042.1 ATP-dependent helicase [Patescibacteria group bacterium]MBU1938850.1 ATP-dependent helicase [Patescibacteria group bacterium]